jgi:Zn-dependent protease with chaperone function
LTIFQQLEQTVPSFKTKARMGMVQAYQQSGNLELAREQCQELLTNPSPKVRQWAQQALAKLPLPDEQLPDTASWHHSTLEPDNKSGFVPQDKSGFMPLEPSAKESQEISPPASATPPTGSQGPSSSDREAGFKPIANGPSAGKTETEAGRPAETDPHQSLFHYQQLNQQPGATVQEQLPSENKVSPRAPDAVSPSTSAAQPGHQGIQPRQPRSAEAALPAARLDAAHPYRLWAIQIFTAIATLWLIHWGIHQSLQLVNGAIRLIRWPIRLNGFYAFDRPHLGLVVVLGGLITLASPWVFDRVLAVLYQQKSLSSRQLQSQCPNTLRLMRRVCRQRGWQVPELRVIPDSTPLSFSYGWSPQTARIVISQGLLDSLSDEELTALYAYEMAHITNWDLPVLSGLGFVLFLLYSGYWYLAQWGEHKRNRGLQVVVGIVSSLLYGLFWLLRKLGLWLSRVRGEYCDRTSLLMTRQPKHHQLMLLDLTRNMAWDVDQRGYLHPLLASLDLLMPLSPQQAVSPGSFIDVVGIPRLIAEDCLNPYRYWLLANNSHSIMGERLLFLERWANRWNQTSIGLTVEQLAAEQSASESSKLTIRDLVMQNSPLIGLVTGGAIALVLWFIGGIVNRLDWQQVSWLYQDDSILQGGLLIGLGMGLLMRVNRLFPELRPPHAVPPNLKNALFQRPPILPVNGQGVTLQGTLVGAPGIPNILGQHLYLQEGRTSVRLKLQSPLGWWRGLGKPKRHPASWIGRPATITGWRRRGGGLLWVDVASLKVADHPPHQIYAPQWTTGLGIAICLWGIWIILVGG